jgi:uncharacterized protein YkwD
LTADEQYLLELINRGRADPAAEAARFGIDLNEGLTAGTISTAAVQPLVPNAALQTAIEGQLTYLASTGLFTHTGATGSQPSDRTTAAGYPSSAVGENLAYQAGTLSTAALDALYQSLFVDAGTNGRGDRLNLLNGLYGDVGSGVTTGQTPGGNGVVIGQDLGSNPGQTYLTGVAYTDAVVPDHFYTPGEGIAGLTVTAAGAAGTFTTTTSTSGGYALSLPAGAYTVTFTTVLAQQMGQFAVTVGSTNVKLDYVGPAAPPPVTPPPTGQDLLGGWRIAAPFARGAMAVDWSTRRLWVAGNPQDNNILEYQLPVMGTGTDPSAWPALYPIRTISEFWDPASNNTDGSLYPNGMVFWQGELWVAPRRYYDTAPPTTMTIYSESGKSLTINLPRQQFAGFVKRFDQDPLVGGGGTESGQGAADGPTAATLDGSTKYLGPWGYGGGWDTREVRPPDYYPVNHVDAWYALDPANHGDGTQGRWASDEIYGGGLWLPEGVAYWPYMGKGEISYSYQNATLSQSAETVQYIYDTTTWRPTMTVTPFGPVLGQDFGPDGEVLLNLGYLWKSQLYQVDPVIEVYAHLPPPVVPPAPPVVPPAPPVVPPAPPVVPPAPPVVPPAAGVTGTVPTGVTRVLAVGSDAGGIGVAQLVDPTTGTAYLTYKDPTFGAIGGMRVVTADFNGDGVPDLAVGTGPGRANEVKVIDGATGALLFDFAPFEAKFKGGVFLAAGDLNGDGKADLVVTPDEGGGPRVRIFAGGTFATLADFFGIDDSKFRGGARAAVGDVNDDGRADLVVAAGYGGGPRVAVYDGTSVGAGNPGPKLVNDFFAFEPTVRNGVFVAVADVNGDGFGDIILGGGPGSGPRVRVLDGRGLVGNGSQIELLNYFVGAPTDRGGVRVAARDLTGNGKVELIAGTDTGKVNILNPVTNVSYDLSWSDLTGGVYVG